MNRTGLAGTDIRHIRLRGRRYAFEEPQATLTGDTAGSVRLWIQLQEPEDTLLSW